MRESMKHLNNSKIAEFLVECAYSEYLICRKNIPGMSDRARKRAEHFLAVAQLFKPCKYPTVLEVFIFDDIPF